MPADERTILHEWFEEVWNQGREETIFRLFAEDGIAHGITDEEGRELRGPSGFVPFVRQLMGAFPDIRIDVEDAVQQGDKVAVRCVVRGTHTGEGLGIAPTQRPVEFTGMSFVHVRDGQIAEAWNNFDFQTLMAQITEPPADDAPHTHA
jgi:steroid delta-isomerase-like uncharacterized protein